MTTVFKKRLLANYSHTIAQDPPKPVQRIRLKKRKGGDNYAAVAFIGLLKHQKSSYDAFQTLLRIADAPSLAVEDVPGALQNLIEYYQQQNETYIRIKVLSILSDIGSETGADSQGVIEEIMCLLKNETSHHVIAQGLSSLLRLCNHLMESNPATTIHLKLILLAKQCLSDTSHLVKQKALEILGELLPIGQQPEAILQGTVRLISDYIHSQDARVRSAAFNTMIVIHRRGLKLPITLYEDTCEARKDDYEIVRRAALNVMFILATTYPDHPTKLANSVEELRLVDDAFSKICFAFNDLSMIVRTEAAQLLGKLNQVSPVFLNQTLDKKLFSNMRKKRSAHERSREIVTSGEYSRGRRFGDDSPQEVLNAQQINLISSGSCGAFVHGLEDEFLEVRSASVDSICSLSLNNKEFAELALEFLVDMFNDEIEDVRLKAIDSLTRISPHIELRVDQLETILSALEDVSLDVREGLHRMLASSKLSTKDCLNMTVRSLLDNLKKYPQDKKSTWRCMQKLGSRHSKETLPLVPELLEIHVFFETVEPVVEDPCYISLLILVFNAAQHCPTMLPLFEDKTIRHYSYLRDTMPQLVPPLRLGSLPSNEIVVASSSTPQYLNTLLSRFEAAQNSRVRMELLVAAERDLSRLATIDDSVAGAAQFTALYISSQLLMSKVLGDKMLCYRAPTSMLGDSVRTSISQLFQNCLKLQHAFTGLGPADIAVVHQFKVKTLILQLVHVLKTTDNPAMPLWQHFLMEIENMQKFFSYHKLKEDNLTLRLCEMIDPLEEELFRKKPMPKVNFLESLQEVAPVSVVQDLFALLKYFSNPPRPHANVRMCHAVLSMPSANADSALKFPSGLVMGVPLEAEVYSLRDLKTLRLKVKYPDQQTHLIVPRKADLRLLNPEATDMAAPDYILRTTVLISHQVWTEALYVDISLTLDLTDMEEGLNNKFALTQDLCVDLCKPVKVYVSPKPIRRGI